MDAGGCEKIVLLRNREGALRIAEVAADRDRACDVRGSHAVDDGIAVGVEGFVMQVRVRVEKVGHYSCASTTRLRPCRLAL